jgi:hypothetical protein
MPIMPRLSNKLTKIAYKILGVPANLKGVKNTKKRETDRRLVFEEAFRVR